MGEATRNLPLSYRPEELDDWGTIRFAPDDEGRARRALKVSMPTHDEAVLGQHRRNGTDPCEEFGRRIITAVNAHDDLVAALKDALIMIGRLKKQCRISDGAVCTEDGRVLKLTDVEIAARAALAKAQGQ